MKYFIDTEFIEGFKKPLFGKRRHFIDLISIGIYAEDGRTYYAVSNEFNPKDADEWVTKNVLDPIELEFYKNEGSYAKTYHHESLVLKNFLKWKGKSNKQIANEIQDFCRYGTWNEIKQDGMTINMGQLINRTEPEFYGYYADYDWVLFCSLYGRMIELPNGYPMFCYDLKQMLDEKTKALQKNDFLEYFHREDNVTLEEKLKVIKRRHDYPQQENEHNALADAKWNYDLYEFILKLGA